MPLVVPLLRNVLLLMLWAWLSLTTPKHLLFLRLPPAIPLTLRMGIVLSNLTAFPCSFSVCFLPYLQSKPKNSAQKKTPKIPFFVGILPKQTREQMQCVWEHIGI